MKLIKRYLYTPAVELTFRMTEIPNLSEDAEQLEHFYIVLGMQNEVAFLLLF